MKRISQLLTQQPYYTLPDLARILDLALPSARVFACRKVKSGELIRARRNLYLLPQALKLSGGEELFRLANVIQTPSHVSYLSALSFHGISTQILLETVESSNPVRSKTYTVGSLSFRYYYCRPPYYFGYERQKGYFLASPEKALLDCLYLISLGRYALDQGALDLKNIQWSLFEKNLKKYSPDVRQFCHQWRKKYEGSTTTRRA